MPVTFARHAADRSPGNRRRRPRQISLPRHENHGALVHSRRKRSDRRGRAAARRRVGSRLRVSEVQRIDDRRDRKRSVEARVGDSRDRDLVGGKQSGRRRRRHRDHAGGPRNRRNADDDVRDRRDARARPHWLTRSKFVPSYWRGMSMPNVAVVHGHVFAPKQRCRTRRRVRRNSRGNLREHAGRILSPQRPRRIERQQRLGKVRLRIGFEIVDRGISPAGETIGE